jgi:hypothetical protein
MLPQNPQKSIVLPVLRNQNLWKKKKTCHPLTSHVTPSFSHAKESRTPFDLYWNNYYKKHAEEMDYNVPVKEDLIIEHCTPPCESTPCNVTGGPGNTYINGIFATDPFTTDNGWYELAPGDSFIMVSGQLGIGLKNDNGSLAYDGVYYNSCGWHQWNDPLYDTPLPPATGNGTCMLLPRVTNHGFFCGETHTYGWYISYYLLGTVTNSYSIDGQNPNTIIIGNTCINCAESNTTTPGQTQNVCALYNSS